MRIYWAIVGWARMIWDALKDLERYGKTGSISK
jgi:hypothetical protein